MQPTAFGHQIQTLHEGLTAFQGGAGRFIPMQATDIDIQITAGVAIIRTQRVFRNDEDVAIEAVLTMPVGFDAVVTGLSATVDDRKLVAVAKPQSAARDDYEVAIDKGKMAILHEEVLKGVHTLSVAQLAPGKEVVIELETVTTMGCIAGDPFLRIPTNVGQIYGTSPLMPADDLITSPQAHYTAKLSASCDQGIATLDDGRIISQGEPAEVILNKAIELRVVGGCFGKVSGQSAKGQVVELELKPIKTANTFLDMAVLVDRSGSTASPAGHNGATIWSTMRDGLSSAFSDLQNGDQISLWQFDSSCEKLGVATGSVSAGLVDKLEEPAGGTDLAEAVTKLLDDGVQDILVLTDGQTWAHDVDDLKSKNARISAILVGDDSLDANIGHLCAMTGGQVFYAPGDNVTSAISTSLTVMRSETGRGSVKLSKTLPKHLAVKRAGVEMAISWLPNSTDAGGDAIGRYAASLALPFLQPVMAKDFAESHCLCSHMTSLVLVDEAGDVMDMLPEMRKVPLMESQARMSVSHSMDVSCCELAPSYEPSYMSEERPEPDMMFSASIEDPRPKAKDPETYTAPRNQRIKFGISSLIKRLVGVSSEKKTGSRLTGEEHLRRTVKSQYKKVPKTYYNLAVTIDWDKCSNNFLINETTDLARAEQKIVQSLAESLFVIELAVELNVARTVVALALLAKLVEDNDRSAKRFTHRILGSLELTKLEGVVGKLSNLAQ